MLFLEKYHHSDIELRESHILKWDKSLYHLKRELKKYHFGLISQAVKYYLLCFYPCKESPVKRKNNMHIKFLIRVILLPILIMKTIVKNIHSWHFIMHVAYAFWYSTWTFIYLCTWTTSTFDLCYSITRTTLTKMTLFFTAMLCISNISITFLQQNGCTLLIFSS